MTSSYLVCIPTYNEKDNISWIINRLFSANPNVEALVIDDNSPDGTAEIVRELQNTNPRLHLLVNLNKSGLGGAYRNGFRWGIEHGFDFLIEMDADGSHQPEQLHKLIENCESHDLVIGSRWVKGGKVLNWPFSRKLLSLGGNLYVRTVLGIPTRDATAGFRIYSANTIQILKILDSNSQGYIFQVDGTYRAIKSGLKVKEVPIDFVERENGVSKMSKTIVIEAISQVTIWAIRHRLFRQPLN